MPDVSLKAKHALVCGDTGAGKSELTWRAVKDRPRVLIWDPDDEYQERGCTRITRIAELIEVHRDAASGRFCFVREDIAAFGHWCDAAFLWGNCVAVAEEIADVTHPGKAFPPWGSLIRRTRKRGVEVWGVTQRPQESDKTILTQAQTIHIGMMPDRDSIAYLARRTGIDAERIAALGPLEWLHWDKATRAVTTSKLTFTGRRSRKSSAPRTRKTTRK